MFTLRIDCHRNSSGQPCTLRIAHMPFDNLDHCILDDHNYNYDHPRRNNLTSQFALAEQDALSEAERNFGWLTADVARLMRTIFDRRVKTLGLTRPQWLALVRLKRRPGASQSELADMMEIERAPAGKIVDRLEERGWIERRTDPGDRRINRIFLTELGERVHATISPIAVSTVADALGDLSANEISRVTTLMSRIKTRLVDLAETDSAADIDWPEGLDAGEIEATQPP